MKKLILLTATILLFINTDAQKTYGNIGIRGGESSGIIYNFYADGANSLGILLKLSHENFRVTILKEKYLPVLLNYSEHLFFYKGIGAHAGFESWYKNNFFNEYYYRRYAPVIGVDGIAGIEYRFFKYPISCGIEYKPYIDLLGRNFFSIHLWDFGCTVKYSF